MRESDVLKRTRVLTQQLEELKRQLEETTGKLEETKKSLLETWHWSFKKMRDACREEERLSVYEAGVLRGMSDATSAALLPIVGGQGMYDLWQSALEGEEKQK